MADAITATTGTVVEYEDAPPPYSAIELLNTNQLLTETHNGAHNGEGNVYMHICMHLFVYL